MLPAADLSEILTNLAALNLQPNTAAAVLGAVLAPLLRSSSPAPVLPVPPQRAARPRSSPRPRKRRRAAREARERAIAELKTNPNATLAEVAKLAGVSHGTAINARKELAAEGRKQARKEARRKSHEKSKAAQPERRQRAQRFLKDALAHGPKQVSDVEEAAEKAHVDAHSLEQARGDLGVLVGRSNTGVQAVTWSLPAP